MPVDAIHFAKEERIMRHSTNVMAIVVLALALSLVPAVLAAADVHSGTFSVGQGASVFVYTNLTGGTQAIVITVCSKSPGQPLLVGGGSFAVQVGGCRT